MNAYGMCVGSGRGVEPNPTLAVYWFRRAAAAGFPPAMENLAASYESGRGVDRKDATAALVWQMRARAARGDRAARDWLAANGHALKETP
jgi:TPR repeat protein